MHGARNKGAGGRAGREGLEEGFGREERAHAVWGRVGGRERGLRTGEKGKCI